MKVEERPILFSTCTRPCHQWPLLLAPPPPLLPPRLQSLQRTSPHSDFPPGGLGHFPSEHHKLIYCRLHYCHCSIHFITHKSMNAFQYYCFTCTILMVAGAEGSRTSTYFCRSAPPFMATNGSFTWVGSDKSSSNHPNYFGLIVITVESSRLPWLCCDKRQIIPITLVLL